MSRYQPPFSITPAILNLVVEIGELPGHWLAKLCLSNRRLLKRLWLRKSVFLLEPLNGI